MDSWPIALQQKLNVDAFEKKFGSSSVRSDNDIGAAKVRSRFTDAIDVYGCQILIDFSEYSNLEVFYKTTLNNGVNRFLFTDPFSELETEFRFVEPPVIRPLGGRVFQVNMLWEKMSLGSTVSASTEGVWPLIPRTYEYTDLSDPGFVKTSIARTLSFDRILNWIIAVVETPFTGPGLTSLKLDIGIVGDTTKFINGLDLMGAAGTQDSSIGVYFPEANTSIIATITAVGTTLDTLTAGELKILFGESMEES